MKIMNLTKKKILPQNMVDGYFIIFIFFSASTIFSSNVPLISMDTKVRETGAALHNSPGRPDSTGPKLLVGQTKA